MGTKKKITGAIVCTGLALSFFAGGSIRSSNDGIASAAKIALNVQQQAESKSSTKDLTDKQPTNSKQVAAFDEVCNQHKGLVNGFYSCEEYIALKAELDVLIADLAMLDENSIEYREALIQIDFVWGKISILAGKINSQVSLILLYTVELTDAPELPITQNIETFSIETFNYNFNLISKQVI